VQIGKLELDTSLFQTYSSRIWAGQEAQNEFKVRCDHLLHCFFVFWLDAF